MSDSAPIGPVRTGTYGMFTTDLLADADFATTPVAERRAGAGDGKRVAALVAAAAGGDHLAWNDLVARFSAMVWAIARAHRMNMAAATEVSRLVWQRLVDHLGQIRPGSVGVWLASATRQECLRLAAPTNQMSLGTESTGGLLGALDQLSDEWRPMMRLALVTPHLGDAEIAAALGLPIEGVGRIRRRGLRQLRESTEVMQLVATRVGPRQVSNWGSAAS